MAAELEDARSMVDQLQSLLAQRDHEAREQLARLVDLQRHRDEAVAQLRRAEVKVSELESRLAEEARRQTAEDMRVDALTSEIEGLKSQVAETQGRADSERRSLEAELTKLKTTLISVQGEYGRLRDDVAPSMAKARRHDLLLQVLPAWLEGLLVRMASRGS
jgi:chromosome segregation ATPase